MEWLGLIFDDIALFGLLLFGSIAIYFMYQTAKWEDKYNRLKYGLEDLEEKIREDQNG